MGRVHAAVDFHIGTTVEYASAGASFLEKALLSLAVSSAKVGNGGTVLEAVSLYNTHSQGDPWPQVGDEC